MERFWCYIVQDDDGWNRLAPALRERLRATASTLFDVELGTYELYLPDEETLASLAAPVRVLVSGDGLPFFAQIAGPSAKAWASTSPRAGPTRRLIRAPLRVRRGDAPILREVSG